MTDIAATRDIPRPGRWPWFGAFAILFLVAAQAEGILTSPPDRDMGDLQKIIYVHPPAAFMTFLGFFPVLVFSLKYLWKGREEDDLLAASSAEVGTAFNGLTLVIGSIWAKPTWGASATLPLRAYVDDPPRRAQGSAAVGILGAVNVPIVYM